VVTFIGIVSSPLPPSDVVYPVVFLNLAKKLYFSRVWPPGWCYPTRGAFPQPPPSDATKGKTDNKNGQHTFQYLLFIRI